MTREEIEHGIDNFNYEQYSENSFKYSYMNINKPEGFVIMDTWNNPFFKMELFQVDTMSFNTTKIMDYFHEFYGGSKRDLFLPWHYMVDIVDQKPIVINTRPFMYKSGFKGFEKHITIMIIGDSSKDVYGGKFYKQIASMIMNQFKYIRGYQCDPSPQNITYWTKDQFKPYELEKELH